MVVKSGFNWASWKIGWTNQESVSDIVRPIYDNPTVETSSCKFPTIQRRMKQFQNMIPLCIIIHLDLAPCCVLELI
jgi:hypothetical protein